MTKVVSLTCKDECTSANEPMDPIEDRSASRVRIASANSNQRLKDVGINIYILPFISLHNFV